MDSLHIFDSHSQKTMCDGFPCMTLFSGISSDGVTVERDLELRLLSISKSRCIEMISSGYILEVFHSGDIPFGDGESLSHDIFSSRCFHWKINLRVVSLILHIELEKCMQDLDFVLILAQHTDGFYVYFRNVLLVCAERLGLKRHQQCRF